MIVSHSVGLEVKTSEQKRRWRSGLGLGRLLRIHMKSGAAGRERASQDKAGLMAKPRSKALRGVTRVPGTPVCPSSVSRDFLSPGKGPDSVKRKA